MAKILTEKEIKKPGLVHLIKAEYLPSFLDGKLSLAHFSKFKKMEGDMGGRHDPDEGLISRSSPPNTRLFVGLETTPGVPVPLEQCSEVTGLSGPVVFRANNKTKCHIFCLSAYCRAQEKRIDTRLTIDRDYILGILNPREFLSRFDQAVLNANLSAHRDYVEYLEVDDARSKPVFFAKPIEFAYQREVRFAVYGHDSVERLTLELGDLRKIICIQDLKSGNIVPVNSL